MKAHNPIKGYTSHIYNLLYIFIAIIYLPVQMTIIRMDAAGRITFVLTVSIILVNLLRNRLFTKTLFSKPVVFWLLWVFYSTVNTAIKNPYDVFTAFVGFNFWNTMLVPLVVMTLVSMEYSANETRLYKWALWAFVIYTFMGVTVMDISTHVEHQELTLGNGLGLNAIYIVFFLGLLRSKRKINSIWVIFLIVAAFVIIIISAQRKAFGAFVILLFFYFLSNFKFTHRQILGTAVVLIVLYFSFNYFMSYSVLGERFALVEEDGKAANTTNIRALDFLGDRAVFYAEGWKLFKEHPITGIGLNNFMKLSNIQFVLHTEYMVQLTECGLIGTMLFVMFYWCLIRNLLKKRKIPEYRSSVIIALGGIASVLFINLTSWTYSSCYYFCVMGVAVGIINKTKNQFQ